MRSYRDIPFWKDINYNQWIDWRWQIRNAVSSLEELEQAINLSDEERYGVELATKYLKMKISPHIITLMDIDDCTNPLRRQFIPSLREVESIKDDGLHEDVNADKRFNVVKNLECLVHRYPSKVLIFPSNYCGAYCRYCFRRKLDRDIEEIRKRHELEVAFEYIKNTPQVEEVILSGGDPLVIENEELKFILDSLSKIPHIKIVRIHTRLPVTVPYRITDEFISLIMRYKDVFPIYFVIHIDTILELSDPTRKAIAKLVDNGFPCLASCPLLRGINDDEQTLRNLWTELVKMRVKPYYLFHSDPVRGLRHFLVPIGRGIEIMHNLYDRMSGLAMPLYCLNVPDGGGHVLINYDYLRKVGEGKYVITNFEGEASEYYENL